MPRLALLLLLLPAPLGWLGCGTSPGPADDADGSARAWPPVDLALPEEPVMDYAPRLAMAHAALPLVDPASGAFVGPGRIWVKGSASVRGAAVAGGGRVALEPPNYVGLLEAPPGLAVVEFEGEAAPAPVEVVVPDPAALAAGPADFSLLSFGCFDPFTVFDGRPGVDPGDGTGRPGPKPDAPARLWEVRELFAAASRGRLPGLSAPELVVGCGDQVYVESAHDLYGEYGTRHPLAAWTVEPQPRPRLGLEAYASFVDRLYRHTWSFRTLDEVFRRVPAVMVWDDHEIRDGWGSHGDEHVYGDTYYRVARRAFVDHQVSRGPLGTVVEAGTSRAPLHQVLRLHGVPMFVMDQRSARDVRVPTVLGSEQWAALDAWLTNLDPGVSPYYVIVSPVPLLFQVSNLKEVGASLSEESVDDLIDFWSSSTNRAELDRILSRMIACWRRGLRAIVISGDMHLSALLRMDARDGEASPASVLAYELVTSGLAGTVDGSGLKAWIGAQGQVREDAFDVGGTLLETTLGLVQSAPNFGGLGFAGGRATAHLIQVPPDGPVHYRVPLVWGVGATELEDAVERGRSELGWSGARTPADSAR